MENEKTQTVMRRRGPRWSPRETDALFASMKKYSSVLLSSTTSEVIPITKKDAWERVTMKVNSVNYPGVSRSVRQVEKKWFDLKSMAKRVLTAKKSLTSLNSEDDTNSDVERSLSLRERCNYYKVLSVIGEQSVSSENAEPMDLAFDITESDDDESVSSASVATPCVVEVVSPSMREAAQASVEKSSWKDVQIVKTERLASCDYFQEGSISSSPQSASLDGIQNSLLTQTLTTKPKKLDILDIQKQILAELSMLRQTQSKILEEHKKRNEIEKEKLELMKRNRNQSSSSRSASFLDIAP